MASIYDLKPRFQGLLRPLAGGLVRAGVTANTVTLSALAGSAAVGVGVALAGRWRALLLLVPVWLFVRMALNAIDGMMAREHGQSSDLGAYLNEVGDVVSDTVLYLPLGIAFPALLLPVAAFSLGAASTEFCGVLGQALGGSRHYEGPMGKSDRAFLFGAVALAIALSAWVLRIVPWVLWLAFALEMVTAVNRVRAGLAELAAARAKDPAP